VLILYLACLTVSNRNESHVIFGDRTLATSPIIDDYIKSAITRLGEDKVEFRKTDPSQPLNPLGAFFHWNSPFRPLLAICFPWDHID